MGPKKAAESAPVGPRAGRKRTHPVQIDTSHESPPENPRTAKRRRDGTTSTSRQVTDGEHVTETSSGESDSDGQEKLQDDDEEGDEDEDEDEVKFRTTARKRARAAQQPKIGLEESPNGKPEATPKTSRKRNALTETPSHRRAAASNAINTPSRRNIADRSARRKSARALISRVVRGADSDDDDDEGADTDLARNIYESSEDEQREGADQAAPTTTAATPSKTPGRRKARARSPTPPRDLPPHEQYFFQNKPGASKTSNNTLSSLKLLTHEEYFSILQQERDPHADNVRFLQSLHAQCFPQWSFELDQGFSVCLYGYGSKRALMRQFATYMYKKKREQQARRAGKRGGGGAKEHEHKIVIINGYVRTTSMREILTTIADAVAPGHKLPAGSPVAMVQSVLSLLSAPLPSSNTATTPSGKGRKTPTVTYESNLSLAAAPAATTTITLILNSIDAPPLRRPAAQALLAQLAAHPRVRLACSADTPDFALLWDSGLRTSLGLVFHDCTTFGPLRAEVGDAAVDAVHELLGRRAGFRAGGRDGVAFVLRSLPENARSLFRLLVGEVLVAMDEGGRGGGAGADGGGEGPGVEYRMLYNKAVEEFICSSEMAFGALLKEFHDHQMITSRRDAIGTELLSLPFRREELEAVLEDLA